MKKNYLKSEDKYAFSDYKMDPVSEWFGNWIENLGKGIGSWIDKVLDRFTPVNGIYNYLANDDLETEYAYNTPEIAALGGKKNYEL